jgi:glutathione S-transferase
MAEYRLHCFAQSGNAYRAALMLNLVGADWEPVFVDFFNGETRTAAYRSSVNEMGEAPVLVHGEKKLSQSGVILEYLAGRSGKFLPRSEDDRLEALRWTVEQPVSAGRRADHRRYFDDQLSVLPARRVRLRHRRAVQKHRRLARPHQGAAALGASL